MAVVAFTDDDGGDGVERARGDAAGALVEVARVLVEDGGQDGFADHGTDETVGGDGAEAFCVALHALAVAA